jgi:hypothetical protein
MEIVNKFKMKNLKYQMQSTLNKLICSAIFVSISFTFLVSLKADTKAATFSLSPAVTTFERGCQRAVDIVIDVTGQSSNAGEIELSFDPTQITIVDSNPGIPGTQVQNGNAYEAYFYNSVDQSNGILRVAGSSFIGNLNSQRIFATINFTSTPAATTTNFTIRFDGAGATLDSNIADSSTSLDLLTNVTNGTYSFINGPCQADTLPPNVIFISPINNQTNVPLNSNVNIRLTDDLSGIDLSTVEFIVNGVTYTPISPQVGYTGGPLDYNFVINPSSDFPANQAITVMARGSDLAGNLFSRQIVFNIPVPPAPPAPPPAPPGDTESPNVVFINPINQELNVGPNETITINLTDNQSGIDINSVIVYLNGQPYSVGDPGFSYTGTPNNYTINIQPQTPIPQDQINFLSVEGVDNSNNSFYRQIIFNYPTIPDPITCPVIEDPITDVPVSDSNSCFGDDIDGSEVPTILRQLFGSGSNIFDNTPFEGTFIDDLTARIGLGGLLSLLMAILLALNLLPLIYLLTVPGLAGKFIAYLFGRRTTSPWGVVTDAVSGKPIPFAICQLFIAGSQYKLNQTITDLEGRYGFVINPGEYRLEIKQSGYEHFAKDIIMKEGDESYVYDVQLNPVGHNYSDNVTFLDRFFNGFKIIYREISKFIFIIGAISSIIAILIDFNLLNLILFSIYLAIFIYFLAPKIFKKPKYASVINSMSNLRIPFAQIKIFEPITWKLVDSQVSNYNGYFDFFGQPGRYAILIAARGYKFPSVKNTFPLSSAKYNGMILVDLRKGRNKLDVYMDPTDQTSIFTNSTNLQSPFSD